MSAVYVLSLVNLLNAGAGAVVLQNTSGIYKRTSRGYFWRCLHNGDTCFKMIFIRRHLRYNAFIRRNRN